MKLIFRLNRILLAAGLLMATVIIITSLFSSLHPRKDNLNTLDFFDSYSNNIYRHVPEPNCENQRFLIYRCTSACHGLGNRQQGIISTFLLAMLTGRTFILEMTSPCDVNKFLEPNLYDWNKCKSFLKQDDLNKEKYYNVLFIGHFEFPASWADLNYTVLWPENIISLTLYDSIVPELRRHKEAKSKIGWIEHLTDPEVEMSILGILFKPRYELILKVKQFFAENVGNRHLVCAHIRYFVSPQFKFDLKYTQKANASCIFRFIKRYDSREYGIYVASDSEVIRSKAGSYFKNFVSTNVTVLHIDREHERLAEMCQGFHDVIFEQLLLSKCHVLALSQGTLGYMAAILRGTSERLFIYSFKTEQMEAVKALESLREEILL